MLILVLLFIVLPIVEIYVMIKSSHAIGFGNTLGLLIVISIIGAWVVRSEGAKAWARFIRQVDSRQTPSKEIADGVCILGAGAMMITPGFVTDVLALLLLLPPTRAVFRGLLLRRYAGGRGGRGPKPTRITYGPGARGPVVDTTASDTVDRPPPGELSG